MKKNHEITPAVERLITEAMAMEADSAQNAGALVAVGEKFQPRINASSTRPEEPRL